MKIQLDVLEDPQLNLKALISYQHPHFNRPHKMNALNSQMLEELITVFSEIQTSPQIRTVLLTGSGNAFMAGADIASIHDTAQNNSTDFRIEEECCIL